MMDILTNALTGLMEVNHGSNVSEQFEDTWCDLEPFEGQNENALNCIIKTLNEINREEAGETFSKKGMARINEYRSRLAEYLSRKALNQ